MFLEWWNTTKNLSKIWQHFSCLLDKGTAKICKKSNSHNGFLRADQDRAKNYCQIGWIGSHHEISIFCIFLQSSHQVDMKNLVKWWKDFLLYFTTLETYHVIKVAFMFRRVERTLFTLHWVNCTLYHMD